MVANEILKAYIRRTFLNVDLTQNARWEEGHHQKYDGEYNDRSWLDKKNLKLV